MNRTTENETPTGRSAVLHLPFLVRFARDVGTDSKRETTFTSVERETTDDQ